MASLRDQHIKICTSRKESTEKKNRMEYLSRSLQNVLVCAIDVRVGFVRENANDSSLFACSFTRDPRIA